MLTVEFEVAGQRFTALNGGPIFVLNPSISFFVNVETPAEADAIYAALADGGQPLMPIGTYPWSERYGWVKDRYGVTWQVMTARSPIVATIAPCLMFTGARAGQAEAAMRAYVEVFPSSKIEAVERYAPGEGPVESVKHGRFVVNGQTMVAMDGHGPHAFTFNEALSLQVMCDDQAMLDRTWTALSEGGEERNCGWLKDRFGVSWQVVPAKMTAWLTSDDAAARDRTFAALMKMKKLDIPALEGAFSRA